MRRRSDPPPCLSETEFLRSAPSMKRGPLARRMAACYAERPIHFRAMQPRRAAMKRVLVGLILSGALALPALAALKEGDKAPEFTAPAALAGGCNTQAHAFSENSDKFAAAGASIVGVSLDKIATLNQFSADPQYCAGKIPVASDSDGKIAKSYDLQVRDAKAGMKNTRGDEIGHGFAERTTFIVTQNGKVAATIGNVSPAENVAKALENVQQLKTR